MDSNTPNMRLSDIMDKTPQPADTPALSSASTPHPTPVDNIAGLSMEEMLDPNKIVVEITDTTTPIVVLFGSPSSGKTMCLFRMICFLQANGYNVLPDPNFRPKSDTHYARMCRSIISLAHGKEAADPNSAISFMLLSVEDDHGTTIFQILEAPGEHYFNPKSPTDPFPLYIHQIINSPNRKVWTFFCEVNWAEDSVRRAYAAKIQSMQHNINLLGQKGKIIFLMNKADESPTLYNRDGTPNVNAFYKKIEQQYPGIFSRYINTGFTALIGGARKFKAIPFSAGTFNVASDGTKTWIPGHDWYCKKLLDAIL